MESNKGTSVTRFGCGPDDEDITIHFYESQGRFEVKNKDIAGSMIFATDDLLEPEVPKGARLLVNEKKTKVDENGCCVFRKTDGCEGFDIAIVKLLDDGADRYTYDNKKPEIRSDLPELELIGKYVKLRRWSKLSTAARSGTANLCLRKIPTKSSLCGSRFGRRCNRLTSAKSTHFPYRGQHRGRQKTCPFACLSPLPLETKQFQLKFRQDSHPLTTPTRSLAKCRRN